VLFDIDIDPNVAKVVVSAQVRGATSHDLTMSPASPVARLDLTADGVRATGSIMTRFCAPPSSSSLQVDLVVTEGTSTPNPPGRNPPSTRDARSGGAGAGSAPAGPAGSRSPGLGFWGWFGGASAVEPAAPRNIAYRGDILTWDSPPRQVLQRYATYVTPTLLMGVELVDSTKSEQTSGALSTLVRFLYAGQVFNEQTLSATVPQIDLAGFSIGGLTVDIGGRLTYRPASPLQSGEVDAVLTGRDSGLPAFNFSAAIATWNWPSVRPRNCSTLPPPEPIRMQEGIQSPVAGTVSPSIAPIPAFAPTATPAGPATPDDSRSKAADASGGASRETARPPSTDLQQPGSSISGVLGSAAPQPGLASSAPVALAPSKPDKPEAELGDAGTDRRRRAVTSIPSDPTGATETPSGVPSESPSAETRSPP
jgi:hypothetical protein